MDVVGSNYWISMAATAAFSASAVLAVSENDIDIFGAFVLGIVTAIGGGTLRDLILDVPVFWSVEQSYLWVALFAGIITYLAEDFFSKKLVQTLVLYLDGFGAALFAIVTTGKVWDMHFCLPIAPIMLGVLTAIGGGLLRDVLAGRRTLLMSRELYAIPVLLGCTLYLTLLYYFPEQKLIFAEICIFLIFIFRVAVIHWGISVPDFSFKKSRQ